MKIEIINLQRIKKISRKEVSEYLEKLFSFLHLSTSRMSLVACDNRFISKLNKKFFSKAVPTDVIAFPLQDAFDRAYLGEVVVSVEEAERVAGVYGNSWKREFFLYITHGVLHLLGFDDTTPRARRIMERKQAEVMKKLYKDS